MTFGKRCAGCGWDRSLQAHHIVRQQVLRRRAAELGIPEHRLLWDERIGLPLCAEPAPHRCHSRHDLAVKRLPRSVIPPEAWEFADEHGLRWAIEREYL